MASKHSSDQEEINQMLSQLEEIKERKEEELPKDGNQNPTYSRCIGNITTPGIQKGLRKWHEIATQENIEYAVSGGIGSQLNLVDNTQSYDLLEEYFGERETDDIDVLVKDRSDALQALRKHNYNEETNVPTIDVLGPETIKYAEEMVEDSRFASFSRTDPRLEFDTRITRDVDLAYTKVRDPALDGKGGTQGDLDIMMAHNGFLYDFSENELEELIRERAMDVDAAYHMLDNTDYSTV